MCELPVFYATTEGQTRRIAERLSAMLHERGIDSQPIDVTSNDARQVDWRGVRAVAVGASVHAGRHQVAIEDFIRANRDELSARPSAFFSVSMRAASPAPADQHAALQLARTFAAGTSWQPRHMTALAGRLAYTKYGWLTRWFIKRIARRTGLATDTSQDHEYTDWNQVARLAEDLVAELHRGVVTRNPVASQQEKAS
ncbi:MAG TPA: flavodoxin domain-containing protein [Vicinamibacterales bacterium]|nr:flavodoxin domain-containing protein [Vicinamibacterales bacterium]